MRAATRAGPESCRPVLLRCGKRARADSESDRDFSLPLYSSFRQHQHQHLSTRQQCIRPHLWSATGVRHYAHAAMGLAGKMKRKFSLQSLQLVSLPPVNSSLSCLVLVGAMPLRTLPRTCYVCRRRQNPGLLRWVEVVAVHNFHAS